MTDTVKRPLVILTDTTGDLPASYRKKYDIKYINQSFMIDETEYIADQDWTNLKPSEFYKKLEDGEHIYTLPATQHEIKSKFMMYAETSDILFITCPKALSKTITVAEEVLTMVSQVFPAARIRIMDSYNASVGEGLIAVKAAELREKGMDLDEIVPVLEQLRDNIVEFVTVGSLKYLSMANKIRSSTAFFGNLANVKPILVSDKTGNQETFETVRGRAQSLVRVCDLFLQYFEDIPEHKIYIIYAGHQEDAHKLQDILVQEKGFDPNRIVITELGPTVGATVGPGTVGLFGYGKKAAV